MTNKLPDVLAGHWETDEGSGMAKAYLADHPTRATLYGGQHSDFAVAFQIAMLGRNDLDHEGKLLMAKDRIRWLSSQLALANQEVARLKPESDMFRRSVEAAAVFQCDGPLAHLLRLGDSTTIDGPPAAAKRIQELEAAARDVVDRYGFKPSILAKEEDGIMVEAGNRLADLVQGGTMTGRKMEPVDLGYCFFCAARGARSIWLAAGGQRVLDQEGQKFHAPGGVETMTSARLYGLTNEEAYRLGFTAGLTDSTIMFHDRASTWMQQNVARAPDGTNCEDCGQRPAVWIVDTQRSEGSYCMCKICGFHSVKNRGMRYVLNTELAKA